MATRKKADPVIVDGEVVDPETGEVQEPETALAVVQTGTDRAGMVALAAMSESEFEAEMEAAKRVLARLDRIMDEVMEEGTDFGIIPGVKRPALLQDGAVQICRLFKLVPTFERKVDYGDGVVAPQVTVVSDCLLHLGSADGPVVGTAGGACSSWEKKYRYRNADRECPECKKVGTIIKGKEEYGGGWLCFAKKGGCGAKWPNGAPAIEGQVLGQIENPDVYEQLQTIMWMADKRAHVGVTRRTTGASRRFTQDEDIIQHSQPVAPQPEAKREASKAAPARGITDTGWPVEEPPKPKPAPAMTRGDRDRAARDEAAKGSKVVDKEFSAVEVARADLDYALQCDCITQADKDAAVKYVARNAEKGAELDALRKITQHIKALLTERKCLHDLPF